MTTAGERGDPSRGPLRYRLATPDDGPSLAKLRWEFHVEDYNEVVDDLESFSQRFLAFWEEAVADGRWWVWVAERGDRIVANTWVFLIDKVPRPAVAPVMMGYMTNVYTVPEARDQGVGSEVVRRVASWAEERQLELGQATAAPRSINGPASVLEMPWSCPSARGSRTDRIDLEQTRARNRTAHTGTSECGEPTARS